jgi:hypothetical protein
MFNIRLSTRNSWWTVDDLSSLFPVTTVKFDANSLFQTAAKVLLDRVRCELHQFSAGEGSFQMGQAA